MLPLILHLIGDYLTQTDWMAKRKTEKFSIALLHAFVYTIPFLLLSPSWTALFVICITHAIIDHYRLAKYIIFYKNRFTDSSLTWEDCKDTGFPSTMPVWMSTWLLIITDNTCHLLINYLALRWL